jgi:hypothetical protein
MTTQLIKGPWRTNVTFITYRDDEGEVRIDVITSMNPQGLPVYDVFLKDAKATSKGLLVSPVLREKMRRALKEMNPLDGELIIH